MQQYPHMIELYACTLNIFITIFLFPIKCIILFGMCLTPNLSNNQHDYFKYIKKSSDCHFQHTHQDLLHMLHP